MGALKEREKGQGAGQALVVVRSDSALAHVEQWSEEDKRLIKSTCFPDSTDNELAMFLHVAAKSGLDPLRKQIHALKHGGRVSFIADINGLQARAAREADFKGIDCAVVYEGDDFLWDSLSGKPVKHHSALKGRPVAAWAVVQREGMRPFVSLVRFEEYNNARNGLWREKPGVMLLKVAKSTALRMAYPEQLGSLYERAELDRATPTGFSREDEPAAPIQRPTPKAEPEEAEVVASKPAAPDPALHQRKRRIWNAKNAEGLSAEACRHWACDVLGSDKGSADWTQEDVEKLEAALSPTQGREGAPF